MAEQHSVPGGNTAASMTPPASADGEKMHLHGINSCSASPRPSIEDDGTSPILEDIQPDHYYEGGRVPVFKPTMDQFRDFRAFIRCIDKYGMKSGIVKVVPPKEWTDSLPALDEAVKTIRIKNPIVQEFTGSHGTFTQANIEKQRSYNLPQWKALSEEISHQPPARRGERRWTQGKTRGTVRSHGNKGESQKRKTTSSKRKASEELPERQDDGQGSKPESPPTPVSPVSKPVKAKSEELSDGEPLPAPKPKGRQPKSVSARRKNNRDEQDDYIDEEAFIDFDYRLSSNEEFTAERCEELETAYWKSLMYNNPMYGADMPGSLFDDAVTSWNVANLPNLLDVLGQKVPGVNTAYVYLGMWKATFAWHLEDVDLYSINYIHFGAPKQWYSISQEDLPRFEAAMRSIWPTDSKNCSQFLRHKTYLISPTVLKSQYGITANKLVHYEGEFVITFPYGYHSGFNLGYNCAESVNFATESWLDYARIAKKCHCETDTVWIDVEEIERKLRGETTPEYYDETRSEQYEGASDLLTPPRSVPEKSTRPRKRKVDGIEPKSKRAKLHLDSPKKPPCVLCPNSMDYEELLPTEGGQSQAHRRCALFIEETSILKDDLGREIVCDIDKIPKARMGLKCLFCREVKGACFQCMYGKCARSYHPTCALLAGVQVEFGETSVVADDGQEYSVPAIDLKCKYHRQKRFGSLPSQTLDMDSKVLETAIKLKPGDLMQFQADKEINGAVVLENRPLERSLMLKVLPRGDVIELPYRWTLIVKKTNFPPLPPNILPLPAHLSRKPDSRNDSNSSMPSHGMIFGDTSSSYRWEDFICEQPPFNPDSCTVDLTKPETLWYYIGKTSTDCRAQYTHNVDISIHNPRSNFLESVRTTRAPTVPAKALARPVYNSNAVVSGSPSVTRPLLGSTPTTAIAPAVQSTRSVSPAKSQASNPQTNDGPPVWSPSDAAMKSTMARRLIASITEHANATAGYTIVNPDFVVQTLLGDDTSPIPKNGLEKLRTSMSESQVPVRSLDGTVTYQPLNMEADDVDHLIRMLRFAVSSLTSVVNMPEKPKAPEQQQVVAPEPVKVLQPQPQEPAAQSVTGKWAYLELQRRQAPPVYCSPYAPGFGFSDYAKGEYGLVGTPQLSRKEPLAADYFAKLSPEDQEKIVQACGPVPPASENFSTLDGSIIATHGPANQNLLFPSTETAAPNISAAMAPDSHLHPLSAFDMTLRADSPASSFNRVPLHYQSPQEYGSHLDNESSLLPRHLNDHHDLFGDQQANTRFWQRSVPWNDVDTPSHDEEHRPFFGPHLRPPGHEYASSDMEFGKGPGSLHSMDMAGFGFDGPDDLLPDPSP
ncbi:hypothetical protein TRV_00056 [Trichophyton verrucosum HKI 0517]|uniref:[histone H3]-trimethyl-L-lysine(9) demethylase n=1 Tax=Trichophyton verrucosum (strain HKI 0517) TaxID=663202 RepID=D4CZ19_TRIVH|nr:uncharacterized protein TRV_00056 [Trichophyton verrucosum HKI 0517]EFE45183.1 hypothetical protein TRV_00056 [Trichophyton verrucosum HKI 0517]